MNNGTNHIEVIFRLHAFCGIDVARPVSERLSGTADEIVERYPNAARALRLYALGFRTDGEALRLPTGTARRLHLHTVARDLYDLAASVALLAMAPGSEDDITRRGEKLAGITAGAFPNV